MNILNARLRGRSGLYRIELDGARIAAISAQQAPAEASEGDIDAASNLVVPPFIEPHIHLDATYRRRAGLEHERHAVRRHRTLGRAQGACDPRRHQGAGKENHRHAGRPRHPACAHPCRRHRSDAVGAQIHARGARGNPPPDRPADRRLSAGGHRVVQGRSRADDRGDRHGRRCGRRHSALREHPRPGRQLDQVPHGPGRAHRPSGGRTATKPTTRSRAFSKCSPKRHGYARWASGSPPATPRRWAPTTTPTAPSCSAC